RAVFKLAPTGPNNEGFPSSAPANGPSTELAADRKTIIDNNHLHFNPYTEAATAGLADLRARIFDEIKARTQETDLSVPVRKGGWWRYSRTEEGIEDSIT